MSRANQGIFLVETLMVLALPFLVPAVGSDAKIGYWSIIFAILVPFGVIYSVTRCKKVEPQKLSSEAVKTAAPTLALDLWFISFFCLFCIVLVIVNVERLPSLRPLLQTWIDFVSPALPIVKRYEAAALLSSRAISQIDLFKVEATTSFAILFGFAASIAWLCRCFTRSTDEPLFTRNPRLLGPFHLLVGFGLGVAAIYWSIFGGGPDLDTNQSRGICVMNFYCYVGDDLLTAVSAVFKMFPVVAFPGGFVFMLRKSLASRF